MALLTLDDLTIEPTLRAALEAVRDRLMGRFAVDRIILFGSTVWGQRDAESDVDLLIILHTAPDLDTEDQISRVIFEINLEYATNLSELIIDRHTWEHGPVVAMPIHAEIEQKGIRL